MTIKIDINETSPGVLVTKVSGTGIVTPMEHDAGMFLGKALNAALDEYTKSRGGLGAGKIEARSRSVGSG